MFGIGAKRKAAAAVEAEEVELPDAEDSADVEDVEVVDVVDVVDLEADADQDEAAVAELDDVADQDDDVTGQDDSADSDEVDQNEVDQDETDEDEADEEEDDEIDWREDGPFDIDEVDLGDEERIDLEALIVTGFPGLQIQLAQNPAGKVQSALAVWNKSALECTLFAEAVSSGATKAVRRRLEDLAEEVVEAGGEAVWEDEYGPFGQQLQLIVPVEAAKVKGKAKSKGEPLVQVSRVWAAKGPRWLLQGRLFGELATLPPDDPQVNVFVEFFRNLVVRRGAVPLPPGEPIALSLPQGAGDGKD
jgi:hypothetical protein